MQKGYVFSLKTNEIDNFKYKCSQAFLYLCIFLFVITIFINVTYSIAPVSGESMLPTLNNSELYTPGLSAHQDYVVLNYIKSYKKGDIIVAKKEEGSSENYIYVIKRLIAVGGDTVEILPDGTVKVNNEAINEDYVKSLYKSSTYNDFIDYLSNCSTEFKTNYINENVLTIPDGYVFYLGDNRGNSYDCSRYGPVKEKMIIAKVDFILKDGENRFLSILKQIFA